MSSENPESELPTPIQVWIFQRHKARMELARTLIVLDHPEKHTPNQSEVIMWLLDTCPIPEMLRSYLAQHTESKPREIIDAEFALKRTLDTAGPTVGVPAAIDHDASDSAVGGGTPVSQLGQPDSEFFDKPNPKRGRRLGTRDARKRRKRSDDGPGSGQGAKT